jgi:hypothetical protein
VTCDEKVNLCEAFVLQKFAETGKFVHPCSDHGTCVDGAKNFTCEREPGFAGALCEVNEDECSTLNFCHKNNSVACIDGSHDYTCVCKDGWFGKNCEA